MAELKLKADTGAGTVSLKGPNATTGNNPVQLTLPVDDGSANQYLKTDGSGVLSWATPTDTNTFGSGRTLQALQTASDSRHTCSGTSWTSVLSRTVTPASTGSKIMIFTSANFGMDSNNASVTNIIAKFKLTWNHSGISETDLQHKSYGLDFPEDSGMDMIFQGTCDINYLHEPSTTNEITYILYGSCQHSSSTLEVTRGGSGIDDKNITVLEIGA